MTIDFERNIEISTLRGFIYDEVGIINRKGIRTSAIQI
jgi:hypothetical protein